MAIGKVKWFNNAKGYGFVLPEEGGEDLFVHYSAIQMDGYKTLKAGQEVQFDIAEGPKGLHAVNIQAAATEDIEHTDSEASVDGVSVEFDMDNGHAMDDTHTPDASSA
jgi:CspA family cold shock protein